MQIPMQTKPVQRAIGVYSVVDRMDRTDGQGHHCAMENANGMMPSEQGIDASFSFRDLIPVAQNILSAL